MKRAGIYVSYRPGPKFGALDTGWPQQNVMHVTSKGACQVTYHMFYISITYQVQDVHYLLFFLKKKAF